MRDTILFLLIEVLYLYEFRLAWWLWVLVLIITLIIGVSFYIAKTDDVATLELLDELYKHEDKKRKDTKTT